MIQTFVCATISVGILLLANISSDLATGQPVIDIAGEWDYVYKGNDTLCFNSDCNTSSWNLSGGRTIWQSSSSITGQGISCGTGGTEDCSEPFANGTSVTLAAEPATGYQVGAWSGCRNPNGSTCSVPMTEARSMSATFMPLPPTLVAAVLPSSRSVEVGGTATAFATILNGGGTPATGCTISPAMSVPATFLYQTTNPSTNALTGSPNTPASIPAGGGQSFLIAFTMGGAFDPTDVTFDFSCSNAGAVPVISGVNTMLLSASSSPVPDVIMIAATSPNDGIVRIANGLGAIAVATSNVGASSNITISADTGAVSLPISLSVCQTNPSSGACFSAPRANVTTLISAGATPTFSVFVEGFGNVPFNAAVNRVFIRASDRGVTRGATSVAVRTQ
jgi:List-Bact-rpt repeat protein